MAVRSRWQARGERDAGGAESGILPYRSYPADNEALCREIVRIRHPADVMGGCCSSKAVEKADGHGDSKMSVLGFVLHIYHYTPSRIGSVLYLH